MKFKGHRAITVLGGAHKFPRRSSLPTPPFSTQYSVSICLFLSMFCVMDHVYANELSNSLQPQRCPSLTGTSLFATPSVPLCGSMSMTCFILSNHTQANFAQRAFDQPKKTPRRPSGIFIFIWHVPSRRRAPHIVLCTWLYTLESASIPYLFCRPDQVYPPTFWFSGTGLILRRLRGSCVRGDTLRVSERRTDMNRVDLSLLLRWNPSNSCLSSSTPS
jgi:hypothetical protein